MTPTRPALRWHGGKWRIAPWIISHFPPHRVYVEPFGGAGSVLLRKPRVAAEVYNDLDTEVVNLFRVLRNRRQSQELEHLLRLTPFARAEMQAAYETPPPRSQMVERARRLVVRAFMGHGADSVNREARPGFRGRRDGSPYFPAWDWAGYHDALPALVDRLQGVVIEEKDALQLMQELDAPDALHYVDPPYVPATRQARQRKVYACEMDDAGHKALARMLHGLQGMVVLSGYHSPLYDRLFKGWTVSTKAVYGEKAVRRTEVLWLNPAAVAKQAMPQLF